MCTLICSKLKSVTAKAQVGALVGSHDEIRIRTNDGKNGAFLTDCKPTCRWICLSLPVTRANGPRSYWRVVEYEKQKNQPDLKAAIRKMGETAQKVIEILTRLKMATVKSVDLRRYCER
jgi:hypothetical protein